MSQSFLQTVALSKIYIGPVANTISTLEDFEAIADNDWTEITGLIDLGKWGASGNEITTGFINDRFVHRNKGNIDNGKIEVMLARNPFDPGQNIFKAAVQQYDKYAIKVVLNDKPTADGTASTFYFRGVPMSYQGDFGEVNNVVKVSATIGIDGELFEVPADVTIVFNPTAGALPDATSGTAYSENIVATGGLGTPTYSISAGALPSGITLNSSTGHLSGTHTGAAAFSFTVKVTFSEFGDDTAAYTLHVD